MNGNNQNRMAGPKLKANAQKPELGVLHVNFPGNVVAAPLANLPSLLGLLTRRDFAARCQVDVRTVERWQAEGVVPFIKVREIVRFHWPTCEAHLLAHFTVLHDGEGQGAKAETLKN